jgi:protein phosphatase methylesterase 1
MSDLQRAFAKAKLAGLPAMPPPIFDEAEEEEEEAAAADRFDTELQQQDDDSSSASSASSASSTGTIIPSQNQKLFARPQGSVGFLVHFEST